MPPKIIPPDDPNLKRCSRCRGYKDQKEFWNEKGQWRETCNECRVKDVGKRARRAVREQRERQLAASSGRPGRAPPPSMEMGIISFAVNEPVVPVVAKPVVTAATRRTVAPRTATAMSEEIPSREPKPKRARTTRASPRTATSTPNTADDHDDSPASDPERSPLLPLTKPLPSSNHTNKSRSKKADQKTKQLPPLPSSVGPPIFQQTRGPYARQVTEMSLRHHQQPTHPFDTMESSLRYHQAPPAAQSAATHSTRTPSDRAASARAPSIPASTSTHTLQAGDAEDDDEPIIDEPQYNIIHAPQQPPQQAVPPPPQQNFFSWGGMQLSAMPE